MTFKERIESLSYIQTISISLLIALAFAIPAVVLIAQERTRLGSKAYQKPQVITSKEKLLPGPIPAVAPKIGRVFPWVGKIGDIVWLQGENFGNNPSKKRLIIGGVMLTEDYITSWQDTEIQAVIPQGAKQGGIAEVRVGQHPSSQSLPMVLYDKDAKIKLRKKGTLISAQNAGAVARAVYWTGDERTPTETAEIAIAPIPAGETPLFDTLGKPILTILLYDAVGTVLPYYVDPIEFGF